AIANAGILEFANRGLPVTATGVTVSGPGNLALLNAAQPVSGSGTGIFLATHTPAANDLTISAPITDGFTTYETQTITIAGTPVSGFYQLQGGPLTGPTTPIPFNAVSDEIRVDLARVLPTGVKIFVSQTGTAPNITTTITFVNLAASVPAMQVINSSILPATASVTPAISA